MLTFHGSLLAHHLFWVHVCLPEHSYEKSSQNYHQILLPNNSSGLAHRIPTLFSYCALIFRLYSKTGYRNNPKYWDKVWLSKQSKPISDVAEWGIWSGFTLFDTYHQTVLNTLIGNEINIVIFGQVRSLDVPIFRANMVIQPGPVNNTALCLLYFSLWTTLDDDGLAFYALFTIV